MILSKKIRFFMCFQFFCLLGLSLLANIFFGWSVGFSIFCGAFVSMAIFCFFHRLAFRGPVGEFAKKIVFSFYSAEVIKICALLLLLTFFLNWGAINSSVFILSFLCFEGVRWLFMMRLLQQGGVTP